MSFILDGESTGQFNAMPACKADIWPVSGETMSAGVSPYLTPLLACAATTGSSSVEDGSAHSVNCLVA
jgi:hypothetical protein